MSLEYTNYPESECRPVYPGECYLLMKRYKKSRVDQYFNIMYDGRLPRKVKKWIKTLIRKQALQPRVWIDRDKQMLKL